MQNRSASASGQRELEGKLNLASTAPVIRHDRAASQIRGKLQGPTRALGRASDGAVTKQWTDFTKIQACSNPVRKPHVWLLEVETTKLGNFSSRKCRIRIVGIAVYLNARSRVAVVTLDG